jgi:choline-sulfatase
MTKMNTQSADRPNIVLLQADQLAAGALRAYGNQVVRAPHLDRLAAEGVVFDRAYCNSPLCAPSRASMLTGLLPSAVGAFDNAADFSSSVPTFAHHLRRAGYRTALVGRMHFVGPDQLHGFDERLTSDVYPATYDMVPDWRLPDEVRLPWYHNADSVLEAGVAVATVQRDFDEEVTFRSLRYLADQARRPGPEPFLLVSSFIHPHDPYEPPAEHWHRYDGVEIDLPQVPALPLDELDPHSRRLRAMCELDVHEPTTDQVRRARRAYYASVSFVDDQVGRILDRLEELGLRENTVVIVTSDHGELLGERGLWYKMSPFEDSTRVPLIVSAPGRLAPRRVADVVSLVDVLPTLVEVAGGDPVAGGDGSSIWSLAAGLQRIAPGQAVIEYLAEGVSAPQLTLVQDHLKLVLCAGDPDQLYDLQTDPDELTNLATDPAWAPARDRLRAALLEGRDLEQLRTQVLDSQSRRRLIGEALATGPSVGWDHRPSDDSDQRYVRGDFWAALARGRVGVEQVAPAVPLGLDKQAG